MSTRTFHGLLTILVILAGSAWAQESPREITLMLGDYRFTPDELEVQAGRPVILTLINKDGITPHSFTLQDAAGGWIS